MTVVRPTLIRVGWSWSACAQPPSLPPQPVQHTLGYLEKSPPGCLWAPKSAETGLILRPLYLSSSVYDHLCTAHLPEQNCGTPAGELSFPSTSSVTILLHSSWSSVSKLSLSFPFLLPLPRSTSAYHLTWIIAAAKSQLSWPLILCPSNSSQNPPEFSVYTQVQLWWSPDDHAYTSLPKAMFLNRSTTCRRHVWHFAVTVMGAEGNMGDILPIGTKLLGQVLTYTDFPSNASTLLFPYSQR